MSKLRENVALTLITTLFALLTSGALTCVAVGEAWKAILPLGILTALFVSFTIEVEHVLDMQRVLKTVFPREPSSEERTK
jgi:hypothetical protein